MQVSTNPPLGSGRFVQWSSTLPALVFCLLLVGEGVQSSAADDQAEETDHWAFQPLMVQTVPSVKNRDWPQTAVDNYILAKLEASGLSPSSRVDKRTLIRRITFDLVGLPPTPGEINAFLADRSPDAFSRIVDRLLASPRYGERWGRHWLDVARYADSNGFDENVAHGNAWRYRDYVVSAFNRDKPFDRFVIEQLAGDLLPFDGEAQQHEQLIATGFLSIGPKVLAETDQAKMRMDIIDEQLDTMGRAFLGLTLGCARCHDHKFDPIATADYYGLAGIFKSTLTMRKYIKVAEWHEHLLPSAAASELQVKFDAAVAAAKTKIAGFRADADKQVRKKLAEKAGVRVPEKLETLYPAETKSKLKALRDELAALEKAGPNLPAAMGVTEDKVKDIAIHIRGNPLELGEVVVRRTPLFLRGPRPVQFSKTESGRRELAGWLVDPRHPLTARVFVNRVWRWHFGRGLVRTTDNFGLLGEDPSHPGLLDYLARRFVTDQWSVKTLHRLIVMSSTYQQETSASERTLGRDPENHLYSRARVRRLEAETVRDALLAASGQLDPTMRGSLLELKNRAYFFDHTSKDLTTYDSRRRSLYLPVVRNNVFELFGLLDFPDPAVSTGDRSTTVVASQALLMLNSEFVMQAAARLTDRLLAGPGGDDQRLVRLYTIAFGREPTDREREADRAFLLVLSEAHSRGAADPDVWRTAWGTLCHVVLATNEFIYLR
jgi:cytochrome c553